MEKKSFFFIGLAFLLWITIIQISVESQRVPSSTGTKRPQIRHRGCSKEPPNFQEINLPCGGYDRRGCQSRCQNLTYPKFYCRKEEFCLCHSGDLYSC